jgi:hypothetical protein
LTRSNTFDYSLITWVLFYTVGSGELGDEIMLQLVPTTE